MAIQNGTYAELLDRDNNYMDNFDCTFAFSYDILYTKAVYVFFSCMSCPALVESCMPCCLGI